MQPGDAEGRNRRTAWAVTWVAYATSYLGRKGFGVAKKVIERELGVGRGALAAIDTGYLAFYALGQFWSGALGDRIGARRLLGGGLLLSAAMCACFGAGKTALVLGVAFAVNGLAQSAGWPATTRAMAEWTTDDNRRRVMALWATCYQFGGIGAAVGAAYLLRFGWRAAFFVPALMLAAIGALVLSTLAPGPGAPERGPSGEVRADDALRRAAIRATLRSPLLWCFGLSYFAIKLIRYSFLFWLPYYLADSLGYAPDRAGYLSTAFEVGGVFGVVGAGLFSDRFRGVSRSLLSAVMLVGLTGMLVLYTQVAALGPWANVAGLTLVGVCLYGPDSLLSGAAAQDAGGEYAAATATGLVNGIGSVGAILQGALNAWVSEKYGWHAVFVVLIVLAGMGALVLVPTFKQDRTAAPTRVT
jgi:sugar phosphate permease